MNNDSKGIAYTLNGVEHRMSIKEFWSVRPGDSYQTYALGIEPRHADRTTQSISLLMHRFDDAEIACLLGTTRFAVHVKRTSAKLKRSGYTDADLARVAQGGTAVDIAMDIGRCTSSVSRMAIFLGVCLDRPRTGVPWTVEELRTLAEVHDLREVAALTGRTFEASRRMRAFMRDKK